MEMLLTVQVNDKIWSDEERMQIIKRAVEIYMLKRRKKRLDSQPSPELQTSSMSTETAEAEEDGRSTNIEEDDDSCSDISSEDELDDVLEWSDHSEEPAAKILKMAEWQEESDGSNSSDFVDN